LSKASTASAAVPSIALSPAGMAGMAAALVAAVTAGDGATVGLPETLTVVVMDAPILLKQVVATAVAPPTASCPAGTAGAAAPYTAGSGDTVTVASLAIATLAVTLAPTSLS
jgi:hypothetical protein